MSSQLPTHAQVGYANHVAKSQKRGSPIAKITLHRELLKNKNKKHLLGAANIGNVTLVYCLLQPDYVREL